MMLICMKHADYPHRACEDCRDELRLKLYPRLVEAVAHLEEGHNCLDFRGIAGKTKALEQEFPSRVSPAEGGAVSG